MSALWSGRGRVVTGCERVSEQIVPRYTQNFDDRRSAIIRANRERVLCIRHPRSSTDPQNQKAVILLLKETGRTLLYPKYTLGALSKIHTWRSTRGRPTFSSWAASRAARVETHLQSTVFRLHHAASPQSTAFAKSFVDSRRLQLCRNEASRLCGRPRPSGRVCTAYGHSPAPAVTRSPTAHPPPAASVCCPKPLPPFLTPPSPSSACHPRRHLQPPHPRARWPFAPRRSSRRAA